MQDKGEKYWGWGDRRREGVCKKSWFEFAAKKERFGYTRELSGREWEVVILPHPGRHTRGGLLNGVRAAGHRCYCRGGQPTDRGAPRLLPGERPTDAATPNWAGAAVSTALSTSARQIVL